MEQGSLLIIDRFGKLVKTLTNSTLLDGPWDLTINEDGENAQVFVSNVLSGTVTRLDLVIFEFFGPRIIVERSTQIASGYIHQCNGAALVVGPTGLALDREKNILYVASTGDNAIFAVNHAMDRHTDAGTGSIFIQDTTHLHGPLGLVRAKNGDLITSQGDAINLDPLHPNEIVEYTSKGVFVAEFALDPPPVEGAAFGIALVQWDDHFRFAAVDDSTNNLDVWVVK
ncbi:MAG: YncE family protein [Syntrophobacteraceae bacterium]